MSIFSGIDFNGVYGKDLDYEVCDSMGVDFISDMIQTVVFMELGLMNVLEMIMLFCWDGDSSYGVVDLDYFVYGEVIVVWMMCILVIINLYIYSDDMVLVV